MNIQDLDGAAREAIRQRVAQKLYGYNAYIERLWKDEPTAVGGVVWNDAAALKIADAFLDVIAQAPEFHVEPRPVVHTSVEEAFFDIANQLGGYVDVATPEREAEFLLMMEKRVSSYGYRFRPREPHSSDNHAEFAGRLIVLDAAATQGALRGGHRCDGAIRVTVDGERVSLGEDIPAADAALWATLTNAYRSGRLVLAPDWQDISTAPRDFSPILAVAKGADGRPLMAIVHWADPETMFSSSKRMDLSSPTCDWFGEMGARYGVPFLKWQRLPRAPACAYDDQMLALRETIETKAKSSLLDEAATMADLRAISSALGFDPTNHHNAEKCPYCNPKGWAFHPRPATQPSLDAGDPYSRDILMRQVREKLARTLDDIGGEASYSNYADCHIALPAGHWRMLRSVLDGIAGQMATATQTPSSEGLPAVGALSEIHRLFGRRLYDEEGRLRFMRDASLADVIGRSVTVGDIDALIGVALTQPSVTAGESSDKVSSDLLDFLDGLAANAAPGERKALNPILIGRGAESFAAKIRATQQPASVQAIETAGVDDGLLAEQAKHHGCDWVVWWQGSGERGDHIMETTQNGLGYARELAWVGDRHHDQASTLVAEHNQQMRLLREVVARQASEIGQLRAELGRIKAVIPASLSYEVPDAVEAIATTFRQYVKVAAEASALRKAVQRLTSDQAFETSEDDLDAAAEDPGRDPAAIVRVYRDLWSGNYRSYRNLLVPGDDLNASRGPQVPSDLFEPLFRQAGVNDGDEVEITVRRTGRRPFGNRRIVLQRPNDYGPETDDQMAERLSTAGSEA